MQDFDETMTPAITLLARRKLVTPTLLYLAGHRPLAFAAGQLLAVAAPVAAILGQPAVGDWAALLSDPDGPAHLELALSGRETEPAHHD